MMDTKTSPLVILAFDAGDADLVQRWAREGHLPTFASIMERGAWKRLTGPEHVCEFGCWLSLFSGVSHSRHGHYYFRQLVPGTYDLKFHTAAQTGVLPFWSQLQKRGKKVALIDPPESHPLPGLSGIQISDWASHQSLEWNVPVSVEPESRRNEVRRVFGPHIRVSDFVVHSHIEEERKIYRRLIERIERKGKLCRHLFSQDNHDLIVVGFYEGHTGAHRFWDYSTAARENELSNAIRDIYQAIDRQMGLLLEKLPREANIFVISVYGMKAMYPTTGLTEDFCKQLNYQTAPPAAPFSLHPLALVRHMAPEKWRLAVSGLLPAKIQDRLLADNFRNSSDWLKTKAFAIPSLYTGFIRVNLKGREPQGIVRPGREYEDLLHRLKNDLEQLVDPHTGKKAAERVLVTGEIFRCGPGTSLPDLMVEWRSGSHFIARLTHPNVELKQPRPHYYRSSAHSSGGFVAGLGPCFEKRNAHDFSVLEMAEMFLSLMGESQSTPDKAR